MSGLEALGTAAAIAQLAQYGIQFAQKVVEVYRSSDGTSERLQELQGLSKSLHAFTDDLVPQGDQSVNGKDEAELNLQRIAQACRVETTSLLNLAESLKIHGSKNVLKSVRVVFRLDRCRSDIRKHEHRLGELQKDLHGQLLKIIHAKQNNVKNELVQISGQNVDTEVRLLREFAACRDELLAAISRPAGNEDLIIRLLGEARREWDQARQRQTFLASLQFPTMQSRYEGIWDAGDSTYEWALRSDLVEDDREVHLASWLQQDGGVFWVTGKAGSGKSTLMKHISSQQQTMDLLETWAGDRSLFTASFYFWNAGDSMQKSQKGLLQSILYNVLRQCPELIDRIRASLAEESPNLLQESSHPWTLSTLRHCIRLISSEPKQPDTGEVCFCFFIDGLDEYNGDHEELTRLILTMATSSNVKLCVSSRPWEVFRDAFKTCLASTYWLQLHLHTRGDIAAVAHRELDPLARDRQREGDELDLLVHELIEKAEGVFLWVTLVIKELIKGFRHADDLKSLRKRLDKIPPGLDQYFHHILGCIDPFYEQESARIFLCCLQADLKTLPLQAFNYIARGDTDDIPSDRRTADSDEWYDTSVLERMRKQLNGRCLDLLQVLSTSSSSRPFPVVRFLHRTVRDFLANADVTHILQQRAGPDFDAARLLCDTYLLLLRAVGGASRWQVQWASYVFTYAQSLEFRGGVTMSETLDAACGDMRELFRHRGGWINRITGTFVSDGLADPDDLPTTLTVLIRLGLVRNAKRYLRSHGPGELGGPPVSACAIMALMTLRQMQYLQNRDKKVYAEVVAHFDSDLRPQTSISQLPADSLLRHVADPDFFGLLLARVRSRRDADGRSQSTQALWEECCNWLVLGFSGLRDFSQEPDGELTRALRRIVTMFAEGALDLTSTVSSTELRSRLVDVFGAEAADEILRLRPDTASSTADAKKKRWLGLW